jgi:chromosomal replication initiation ATPase DnaA
VTGFIQAQINQRLARIDEVRAKYPEYFVDVEGITFKSLEDFILWYCDRYNVDGELLFRSVRRGEIAKHNRIIQIMCFCLFPGLSCVVIGRFLHRDHTTILHHLGFLKRGQRKVNDRKKPCTPSSQG